MLFRVGPAGGVARKLSVLLVVEGVALITAGFPEFVLGLSEDFFVERPGLLITLGLAHFLGDAGMVALYPPFLAGTDGYEYAIFWWYKAIYTLGTLLAVPLIAYGILRAHLRDSLNSTVSDAETIERELEKKVAAQLCTAV